MHIALHFIYTNLCYLNIPSFRRKKIATLWDCYFNYNMFDNYITVNILLSLISHACNHIQHGRPILLRYEAIGCI